MKKDKRLSCSTSVVQTHLNTLPSFSELVELWTSTPAYCFTVVTPREAHRAPASMNFTSEKIAARNSSATLLAFFLGTATSSNTEGTRRESPAKIIPHSLATLLGLGS